MNAYIRVSRKCQRTRYLVYSGLPENHKANAVVGEYCTRRQAIRYAKRDGYDLIIRGMKPPAAGQGEA